MLFAKDVVVVIVFVMCCDTGLNELTGSIPSEIGKLERLQVINIGKI